MAQPMNAGTAPMADMTTRASNPAYQAYRMLHVIFTVAPIIMGLDKFFHLLVNWDQYLAPVFARLLGGHTFMLVVGVIEIVAGLIVAFRPRIGGYIVTLWLWGIILNLLLNPIVYDAAQRTWGLDIALRDLGLSIGALALARLSVEFERR
jgi:hypothetical protein